MGENICCLHSGRERCGRGTCSVKDCGGIGTYAEVDPFDRETWYCQRHLPFNPGPPDAFLEPLGVS